MVNGITMILKQNITSMISQYSQLVTNKPFELENTFQKIIRCNCNCSNINTITAYLYTDIYKVIVGFSFTILWLNKSAPIIKIM